jgi:hypothetical protein
MHSRAVTVCLLVAVLVTGCSEAIAGNVRPAPGLAPRPLTGEAVKGVLLDGVTLTQLLHQPFDSKPDLPQRFGGPEELQLTAGTVTPAECAGIAQVADKGSYPEGKVKTVARESWWNTADMPSKVIDVEEAVVALPSVADASALFGTFAQQWNNCNGKTVNVNDGELVLTDNVSEVRVANSVAAATISVETRLASAPTRPMPNARAIGVRANCLVEVEVTFFSEHSPNDLGTADEHTSAAELAHAMMNRIDGLA